MWFCPSAVGIFPVVLLMHVVCGDHFIIADTGNGRLQLCDAASPGGPCETVASVTSPRSVTVDNAGDYIVATGHQIKRCPAVSPDAECEVAVGWEDNGSGDTELRDPYGVFWDPWRFYVIADRGNNRVQRCVATVLHAPCHTVTDELLLPSAVVMDGNGDYVISDTWNSRIRRCVAGTPSPYCQTVTAYGELNLPRGFAIDENGKYVIADWGNHRIQRCAALAARCETMAGTTGVSGSGPTELYNPHDVTLDAEGNYLIADTSNFRIQLCSALVPGTPCQTVAGTGSLGSGPTDLHSPYSVAWITPKTTSTTATTRSSTATSSTTTTSKSSEAAEIALVSSMWSSSVQLAQVSVVVAFHCLV